MITFLVREVSSSSFQEENVKYHVLPAVSYQCKIFESTLFTKRMLSWYVISISAGFIKKLSLSIVKNLLVPFSLLSVTHFVISFHFAFTPPP